MNVRVRFFTYVQTSLKACEEIGKSVQMKINKILFSAFSEMFQRRYTKELILTA
jgi:hypothetical protein